jgi:hypothetical protein
MERLSAGYLPRLEGRRSNAEKPGALTRTSMHDASSVAVQYLLNQDQSEAEVVVPKPSRGRNEPENIGSITFVDVLDVARVMQARARAQWPLPCVRRELTGEIEGQWPCGVYRWTPTLLMTFA